MRISIKTALLVAAVSLLSPLAPSAASAATKAVTVVTAPTWKASITVKDIGIAGSGTIAPAYGRTLVVQKRESGTWKTFRTIKTANTAKATVSLAVPASALWDGRSATTTTRWRLTAPATTRAKAYTSPTTTVSYLRTASPTVVTAPAWRPSLTVKATGLLGSGTVTPAYGRSLIIQKRVNGTWKTFRTIKTANTAKATANLAVPTSALWDGRSATTTTYWRVHLPGTALGKVYTSPTTKVVYRSR